MLGVTGGIELWEKEMVCEFGFIYFSSEIAWQFQLQKSTFDLPWNYLKLCEHQLSTLKN